MEIICQANLLSLPIIQTLMKMAIVSTTPLRVVLSAGRGAVLLRLCHAAALPTDLKVRAQARVMLIQNVWYSCCITQIQREILINT